MAVYLSLRKDLDTRDLYLGSAGPYWYTSGVRWGAVWPWLAGFVAYHWVTPLGPTWWTDGFADLFGTPLSVRFPWLSASLVSFLVAFALMWLSTRRAGAQRLSSWATPDER
jgi:cytosine/uracil/thiamine/allantoin permease